MAHANIDSLVEFHIDWDKQTFLAPEVQAFVFLSRAFGYFAATVRFDMVWGIAIWGSR